MQQRKQFWFTQVIISRQSDAFMAINDNRIYEKRWWYNHELILFKEKSYRGRRWLSSGISGGSVTWAFRYFIHPRGGQRVKIFGVGSRTRYARNVKRVRTLGILALNHRGSIPGMLHSSRSNVSDAETEGLAESSNLLAEGTLFWPRSHQMRRVELDSTDGCGFEVVSFSIRACWFLEINYST